QNPDRLYYDLLGPKLQAHGNRTDVIPVADQLLKRIRISHKEGGIMRVVLDLRRSVQIVASQIPNPDRFMIELRPATPATLPSLLLARPAKQDRDAARSLTRALGLKVSRVVLPPDTAGMTRAQPAALASRKRSWCWMWRGGLEQERPALAKEKDADLFVSIYA